MKHYWLRTGFLWLAIVASSGQAWPADTAPAERSGAGTAARPGAAPAERPTGPDLVTLNFVNADIEGVVKAVSEITGKNFVLDPRVKGTVNIVSAKPMSRALVYEVFLSAMRLQGFTAVEERGRVMIVPEIDAKLHQSLALGPQDKPRAAGDTVQTQVFKLQYESATQMVPVLRPLIASNNTITAYQNNNTLVVTDYASNLAAHRKNHRIDRSAGRLRSDHDPASLCIGTRRGANDQPPVHGDGAEPGVTGPEPALCGYGGCALEQRARALGRSLAALCGCANWWQCSIRPPAPAAIFTSST